MRVPASTTWFVGGELLAAAALSAPLAAAIQRRAPKFAPWMQRLPYVRYMLPNARDAPFALFFVLSVAVVSLSVALACAGAGAAPYAAAAIVWVGAAALMGSVWVDGAFASATDDAPAAAAATRADGTARRLWLHAATGVVAGGAAARVVAMAAAAAG